MGVVLEDSLLVCPICGGPNLHHYKVRIYDRGVYGREEEGEGEESHATVTTEICGDTVIKVLGADNPSSRRGAVGIFFECEWCKPARPMELTIIQHKGDTILKWRLPE
jgi:hypothetical protein